MASKRTVQFEFLVEADSRQIDKFHESLKRVQQTAPVSENVLTSLREELQRFSQVNVKTENSLQGQIAALRDASRNADLTQSEYTKLRLEVEKLQKEYNLLTNNIVGIGNAYSGAAAKAQQFSDAQIAASQRAANLYLNNSGQRSKDAQDKQQFLAGAQTAENVFPALPKSEIGMQQQIANLRNQAVAVDMTLDEYKKLRLELIALEGQYKKLSTVESEEQIASRHRQQRGRKLRDLGGVAQQMAIGGFFGGPEGLAGSSLGAIAGSFAGPGGMLAGAQAGASIGLGVQQLRMQGAAVADVVKELNLAKTTLAQVSNNQGEYNQKLAFARQVSTDYSVGLQATIEGYAKVTAAASANGLTLKETETIYRGLLASGVAFGASQDDLKSIILATTQVLSKGKISAEELSGQLGERIPGAVAKFAQATGRPLAQLAKDLQDGKVSIADFVKFARKQYTDYDGMAKLIGASPEKAGERLNLALTRSAELYGGFFQKLGAGFQDSETSVVNWVNTNEQAIKRWIALFILAGKRIGWILDGINQQLEKNKVALLQSLPGIGPIIGTGAKLIEINDALGGKGASGRREKATFDFARSIFGSEAEFNQILKGLNSEFKPSGFGNNKPGQPSSLIDDGKAAKKAQAEADKQQRIAEQLAAEQRRQQELLGNNAIRLADVLFQHEISLIRRKYALELDLATATRNAKEAGLTGAAREAQGTVNQILGLIEESRNKARNAALDARSDQRAVVSAQASAANTARYGEVPQSLVGGGMSGAGIYRQGGWGPKGANSYGAHFDIARPDGSYFSRNALDAYVRVNGAPLSSGYTVPGQRGGSFGADRSRGAGAHRAWDYAFGAGAGLSLTGGAKWMSSKPGNYGDNTAFMTPDGKVYRLIHGKFEAFAGATGRLARSQPGAAAGKGRYTNDMGDVNIAGANLKGNAAVRAAEAAADPQILQQQIIAATLQSTSALREQTTAISDQREELLTRNRLQMEGVKPELIDQQVKLDQTTREYNRTIENLTENLGKLNDKNDPDKQGRNMLQGVIDKQTSAYSANIEAQKALNATQNEPGVKIKARMYDLQQQVKDTDGMIISLSNTLETEFGNAMSGAVMAAAIGTTSIQQVFQSMLQNIGQSLIQFGTQMLAKQAILGILSMFGGPKVSPFPVAPAVAANGMVASNGIQPFATGGIVNSPTLFKFAEGGSMRNALMGEAGPEAIMPLRRGRDGKLGVVMQMQPYQPPGGTARLIGAEDVGGTVRAAADEAAVASERNYQATAAAADGAAVASERNYQATAAAADGSPISLTFRTVGASDTPFVTREEAERLAAESSKQTLKQADSKWRAALRNDTRILGIR